MRGGRELQGNHRQGQGPNLWHTKSGQEGGRRRPVFWRKCERDVVLAEKQLQSR